MRLLEALDDKALFGDHFSGSTWAPWRAFMTALEGRPLTGESLDFYRRCTGRQAPPNEPAPETFLVCGRRAGKSRIAALLAVEAACLRDWTPHLAPGEVATVAIIAADRAQARTTFGYVLGLLDGVPMLAARVQKRRVLALELEGRVRVEVTTASRRTTRGYSFALVVADELAFWKSETSSEPDRDVLDAVRPGLATLPGARLVAISSPHGRWGALYEAYREHYGREGDPTLVWQCDTAGMNPSVDQAFIARAYEADPAVAASEYGAQFRDDVAQYLDRERVEAVVVAGRVSLPPQPSVGYLAFVDMSGGSSDSAALAIAHLEGTRVVLDLVMERRAPHNPEQVTRDFCAVVKSYGCTQVTGDAYAAGWCAARFEAEGVSYERAERSKSEFYAAFVPLVMTAGVELPDDRVLVAQLCGLERRVARGSSRETIDHRAGARDDVANVTAAAAVLAAALAAGDAAPTFGGLLDPYTGERQRWERAARHDEFDYERANR